MTHLREASPLSMSGQRECNTVSAAIRKAGTILQLPAYKCRFSQIFPKTVVHGKLHSRRKSARTGKIEYYIWIYIMLCTKETVFKDAVRLFNEAQGSLEIWRVFSKNGNVPPQNIHQCLVLLKPVVMLEPWKVVLLISDLIFPIYFCSWGAVLRSREIGENITLQNGVESYL